jgi:hypothetical protein
MTFRVLIAGLLALMILTSLTAIAATNTIPSTRIEDQRYPFGAMQLEPSSCTGIFVTDLITGSGTVTGTAGNDLILGGPGADTIDGMGGDDCILGGGGDDIIAGGDGMDICIGGFGNDQFTDCEGESQ